MQSNNLDAAIVSQSACAARRRWRQALVPTMLFAALAVAPFVVQASAEELVLSLATRTVILAIAAVSLDLLVGACGLVSLGHAAFFGIGAYSVAILANQGIEDMGVQVAAAVAAALVFAAITGGLSLRTRGVQFIMITLAFAQMLFFFAGSLAAYGGDDGIALPGRSTLFGGPPLTDRALFTLALSSLVAIYLFHVTLVRSRFGRVLRGTRDNDTRMRAIGYAPFRFHFVAYLISGTIAAYAGVLLAEASEFVSPSTMSWPRSADLVLMVALGGIGTPHGPILGAIAFVFVAEALSRVTENWHIAFGPMLILAVLFLPGGLIRLFERAR